MTELYITPPSKWETGLRAFNSTVCDQNTDAVNRQFDSFSALLFSLIDPDHAPVTIPMISLTSAQGTLRSWTPNPVRAEVLGLEIRPAPNPHQPHASSARRPYPWRRSLSRRMVERRSECIRLCRLRRSYLPRDVEVFSFPADDARMLRQSTSTTKATPAMIRSWNRDGIFTSLGS